MSRANLDTLISAGYTTVEARMLVRQAIKDRIKYGALGGQEVPRIQGRIYQTKPK